MYIMLSWYVKFCLIHLLGSFIYENYFGHNILIKKQRAKESVAFISLKIKINIKVNRKNLGLAT